MSASRGDQIYYICQDKLEDITDLCEIRQNGADGINAASVQRGDTITVITGCKVHPDCSNMYTNSLKLIFI